MDTRDYKTKTEFIERDNRIPKNIWEIALDIGYSAVKLFSPNMVGIFPSYARRISTDQRLLGNVPKENILYQDMETGENWCVGEAAQNLVAIDDTSDSETVLYGRERYNNPMFKVITRCGLAIAMQKNKFGDPSGRRIIVQTGLPPKYLKMDTDNLKDVIAGHHHFRLKLGSNKWVEYDFEISFDDVFVMSQPLGTLFSVITDYNHNFTADSEAFFTKKVIVFDPGFGTLDIFPIKAHFVEATQTFDDLGMKRVMKETIDLIYQHNEEEFSSRGQEITIPAMQKYLATGKVPYINRRQMKSTEEPFAELLQKASDKVCNEAIDKLIALNIFDYDYLVITGGTGAAWYEKITTHFKDLSTLKIFKGTRNDNLPFVFSNVRGYYAFRFQKIK